MRPRDFVRMEGKSTVGDEAPGEETEGFSAEEAAVEGTESEVADHEE